jgi:hypothetical protein
MLLIVDEMGDGKGPNLKDGSCLHMPELRGEGLAIISASTEEVVALIV